MRDKPLRRAAIAFSGDNGRRQAPDSMEFARNAASTPVPKRAVRLTDSAFGWQRQASLEIGTLGTFVLAVFAIAFPIVLHLISRELAIATCVVLGLLIATYAAASAIIVLLASYLFQNLVVALISPAIESMAQFNSIRAYNFVITVAIWISLVGQYWLNRPQFERPFRVLMDRTTAVLVLIAVFVLVGLLSNPAGAIVYLRNIASPFFLLQIFALVAYQNRLSLNSAIWVLAIVALGYGYFEFFAHDTLMSIINGESYLGWRTKEEQESGVWLKQLQETGRVFRSYRDALLIDFLNTPLFAGMGWQFYRVLGPNFHFISFAYAIAVFAVVLASTRGWYAFLALPLLLILGSKGALLLAVFVLGALLALRLLRSTVVLWGCVALLAIYGIFGIAVGMALRDYHVIGFLGGVRGFLSNPLGRGIGVGGNLSMDMTTIDWSKSQHLGHTDVAVESAVGVLLYQMGVFAFVLFAFVIWLAIKLWAAHARTGDRLFPAITFALMTIMVNGIFQEEALFSPLAFGVIMGFAGLLLGRAYRTAPPHVHAFHAGVGQTR